MGLCVLFLPGDTQEGRRYLAGHEMEVFSELEDLHQAAVSQLAGSKLRGLLGLQRSLLLLAGGLEAGAGHGLPPLICSTIGC